MYKCVECGYEFNPGEEDKCPLCGGGRDMEASYIPDGYELRRHLERESCVGCSITDCDFDSINPACPYGKHL